MDKHHSEKSDPAQKKYVKVCVLASGSKGNAIYVSDENTAILIDAGMSGIQIEKRMASAGLDPETLKAIVVSHEHSDHIKGVGVLSRRFDLPVYMSRQTHDASLPTIGKISRLNHFECGCAFKINGLDIHPFSTSHDAIDPAGFTITRNSIKIGVATDLGIVTSMVREHLKNSDLLVIESNHDPRMLENGPYPWPLKQRIKSRTGHLSNPDTAALLKQIQCDRLSHVILSHLSEENNTPEKVIQTAGQALENSSARIHVAVQDACGCAITLTSAHP